MAVCFCKKSAGSCICCTVLYKNMRLWPGRSLRRLPHVTMPTKFETSAEIRPPRRMKQAANVLRSACAGGGDPTSVTACHQKAHLAVKKCVELNRSIEMVASLLP